MVLLAGLILLVLLHPEVMVFFDEASALSAWQLGDKPRWCAGICVAVLTWHP